MKTQRKADIDIGLAVLCAVTPPGVTLSQGEIADVCGCTRNRIYEIERDAVRKLKSAPKLRAHAEDLE